MVLVLLVVVLVVVGVEEELPVAPGCLKVTPRPTSMIGQTLL